MTQKRYINDQRQADNYAVFILDYSTDRHCNAVVEQNALAVDGVFSVPRAFKFPGIHSALMNNPSLLASFEVFAFIDDDLEFVDGAAGLRDAFLYFTAANLTIGQASLQTGSVAPLWCTRHVPGKHQVRLGVGTVETMMPMFTAAALQRWLPEFARTRSAWGMDSLISWAVARSGGRLGVIDAVQVQHFKKVSGSNLLYRRVGGLKRAHAEMAGYARRLGMTRKQLGARAMTLGRRTWVSLKKPSVVEAPSLVPPREQVA